MIGIPRILFPVDFSERCAMVAGAVKADGQAVRLGAGGAACDRPATGHSPVADLTHFLGTQSGAIFSTRSVVETHVRSREPKLRTQESRDAMFTSA
jgi:hypothetical protein